ncbi:hypothetical protein N7495_009938 [Penicillium taxi]|uniref:uncharacterized protein n=1 Tax=Penicillium taxi TaxID=168475 RepID=UPI0025456B9D|nr:uncharacterized protein N7495_009938 [Penicillium taxi]KAJ5885428.1 hypothetical protein N7495_009938 [Penicillium taxi]
MCWNKSFITVIIECTTNPQWVSRFLRWPWMNGSTEWVNRITSRPPFAPNLLLQNANVVDCEQDISFRARAQKQKKTLWPEFARNELKANCKEKERLVRLFEADEITKRLVATSPSSGIISQRRELACRPSSDQINELARLIQQDSFGQARVCW